MGHGWMKMPSILKKRKKIINRKDIVLVGEHNLENIMAAICAAKLSHASNEGIKKSAYFICWCKTPITICRNDSRTLLLQ